MKKPLTGIFLPITLIFIIAISACKKDNPNNTNQSGTTSYKVKTLISTSTSGGATTIDTDTYQYDTQGRLISDQSSQGSSTYVITGNSIAINIYQFPSTITGTIGNNGYISQAVEPAVSQQPVLTNNYTYDAMGELLTDSNTYGAGSLYYVSAFTWTDSNLISVSYAFYSQGTVTNSSYSYTYLGTREYRDNGFSSQLSNGFAPGTIAGRNSKNLINTETDVISGTTTVYNHAYTFDSKGRVATETVTSTSGTNVYSYTYY